MKLRYITCSDPREMVPVEALLRLAQTAPIVEIAVQAHPSKMSQTMPRNQWFNRLLKESLYMPTAPNLAVHISMEWCDNICQGIIVPEIKDWLSLTRTDGSPVIRRWQINIHGSKTQKFNTNEIANLLKSFPNNEFIFQYDSSEYNRMQKLERTGAKFSILYDASSGTGTLAKNWNAPLFNNHPQGYSGGLSPENVVENLDKIAKVTADRTDVWIDAEGKLKNPDTKVFDINRAKQYITAALKWQKTK